MIYIEHVPRGGGLGVKLDKKKVVKKGKRLRFTNFRAKI
jgi:hypothetical protein